MIERDEVTIFEGVPTMFAHVGRRPGSIGTPIAGVEMRLVDDDGRDVPAGEVGEIAVRGANVMTGYWQKPEETAKAIPDGWFRTGDLARQDDDGYFFIVDRKKETIMRSGYDVHPREIEEAQYEHPAVAEAAWPTGKILRRSVEVPESVGQR